MEVARALPRVDATDEHACALCAARPVSGLLCERCRRRGLTSQEYAGLFWDEV